MRFHRIVLFLVLALLILDANQKLCAQSGPRPNDQKRHPAPADFEHFGVYWTDEAGWRTELQLRNNLGNQDLTVTPALRSSDGTEIGLPAVTIKPADVVSINLHDAILSSAPQLAGKYGSVALRFRATVYRALYAAVVIHDTGHPIGFHFDTFTQPKKFVAGSREGIWWFPDDTATDYLILTNTGDQLLEATLILYDSKGTAARQKVTLSPRQTQRLSVRSALAQLGLSGTYGGIEVAVPNGAGYLDTAHVVFNEATGFSAIMKMFQHHPGAKFEERSWGGVKEWTTRAPMLALTTPDPALGLPPQTRLDPKVFVRNASAKTYTASLHFHWFSTSADGQTPPLSLSLRPHETRIIDVAQMQTGGTLPAEARWASVYLSAPVKPDELVAVAASYDPSGHYGVQTPFIDQLAAHWEGGEWQVDGAHDTIMTAANGGDKSIQAQISIFYHGGRGKYVMEKTLRPEEHFWLHLGKLIQDQVPDKDGRTLPADLTTGTYQFRDLTDPAGGNLFEGKVIVDKKFGHAAYGCMLCCGYPYGGYMGSDPLGLANGGTLPQNVQAIDSCDGLAYDVTASYGNWATGNTSIATASTYNITGVAPGSTSNSASTSNLIAGDGMTYVPQCPRLSDSPQGGVTVSCPSSISVNSSTTISLESQFPTLKTGVGIIVSMQANPTTTNWNGALITEALSRVSASPANCDSGLGNVCQGSSTFVVGQGGTKFGQNFPATQNIFYDDHHTTGSASYLDAAGLQSCTVVCSQTYSCSGVPIATFTVTRSLTKATIQNTPVTRVTVTKQ